MRVFMQSFVLVLLPFFLSASCITGNCKNGKGVYLQKNGSKYIGDFKYGKRTGHGKMIFISGDKYIGRFRNGMLHGKGRMDYKNGDQYKGKWRNGRAHGYGEYTFKNSDRYIGQFASGKFNGKGKYFFHNGSTFDGYWKNNKKHGAGTYKSHDGEIVIGEWAYGELKYSTSTTSTNVASSSSQSDKNKNCGKVYCHDEIGYLEYADGSRYTGEFKNGNPEGQGRCDYANGDRYEGGWAKHGPHGEGVITFASGQTYATIWNYGKPGKQIMEKQTYRNTTSNEPKKKFDNTVNVYALIVGVASYNHLPSLKYTDDDAYRIYAFLKSPEGGAIPDDHIDILIDDAATRRNIIKAMSELSAKADENDVVIMYLSGHGLDGSFVPSDFDGYRNQLAYTEVMDIFNSSRAKHKLCIADACHSGSIYAARSSYSSSLTNFYNAYKDESGGTAILTSSKSEEVSLEYSGLRQGVFSHFLIKGLKGYADANHNKIITVSELYDYIYKNVKSYTANGQTPILAGDYDKDMPVGMIR